MLILQQILKMNNLISLVKKYPLAKPKDTFFGYFFYFHFECYPLSQFAVHKALIPSPSPCLYAKTQIDWKCEISYQGKTMSQMFTSEYGKKEKILLSSMHKANMSTSLLSFFIGYFIYFHFKCYPTSRFLPPKHPNPSPPKSSTKEYT